MKAIELIGDIDEQHRLRASVPEELSAGPVRLIVFLSEEDEAGTVWAHGLAPEWVDELRDSRQDLYTLADGQLIDAATSARVSALIIPRSATIHTEPIPNRLFNRSTMGTRLFTSAVLPGQSSLQIGSPLRSSTMPTTICFRSGR